MSMMDHWPTNSDWNDRLVDHLRTDSFGSLVTFVDDQRKTETVFPEADLVFNAFECTSWRQTKVVILGQDPYHGPGQAHGLSFSVRDSTQRLPPSLKNIFKELASDLDCPAPTSGNLEPWARQGVLLLNTVLTVRSGDANSHQKKGWEKFTDAVIESLNDHPDPIVYLLWGKSAEKKSALIDQRHTRLIAPHPSPLSAHRGFFGSRPFSSVNAALADAGRAPIDWTLA